MDLGGGGDREVDRSSVRLGSALGHGGRETPPFTGYPIVDGERLKGRLDHTEPL